MNRLILDGREYNLTEIPFDEFIVWGNIPMDFKNIEYRHGKDIGFKYKSIKINDKFYSFKLCLKERL